MMKLKFMHLNDCKQVPENVPVNTPFTQVVGHDRDKGPEGKLIYSIIGKRLFFSFFSVLF